MSSLPASTIEQLKAGAVECVQCARRERLMQSQHETIVTLNDGIERQKQVIESLELAVATMRRRLESLEGVT